MYLHFRYTNEMAEQAQKNFKINKKQSRRIYEILRLKHTNTSDKTMYLNYRLDVKNRLNAPFQVWKQFIIYVAFIKCYSIYRL